jgi:hypothetical protein
LKATRFLAVMVSLLVIYFESGAMQKGFVKKPGPNNGREFYPDSVCKSLVLFFKPIFLIFFKEKKNV